MDVNSLSHSKWNCKYHIVFAPKFRRKVAYGALRQDIANILSMLCKRKGVNIVEAEICPDHVHMLVEIPPNISVSELVRTIKMSAGRYMKEHKDWFPSFMGWAKSYCAITYSLAERDTIINYIATQKEHHKKLSFSEELKKIMQEVGIKYD